MSGPDWRVVKLGGSLLEDPALPQRLENWRVRQPDRPTLWVVGGGAAVDRLRERYRAGQLDEEQSHWQAIAVMQDTASRLAGWFPDWTCVESPEGLPVVSDRAAESARQRQRIWFPLQWLRQHAAALPVSWDVTSDSIAALAALHCQAGELVLLKSTTPQGATLDDWIAEGVVDAHLSQLPLPPGLLSLIDFRSDTGPWQRLAPAEPSAP